MYGRNGIIYGLYLVSEPTEIRYVGQTVNKPNRRLNQHRNEARLGVSHLPVHRWMVKHGVENIKMVFLEEGVPESCLDDRETYWISEKKTYLQGNPRGLNLTADGLGSVLCDKTLRRKRDSMRVSTRDRMLRDLLSNRPGAEPLEVVQEIREKYDSSVSVLVSDLVREFGVNKERIGRILRNLEYPEEGYEVTIKTRKRGLRKTKPVSREAREYKARRMRERWLECKDTSRELGAEFGVHHLTVMNIVNNHSWYDPNYVNTRGAKVIDSVKVKISSKTTGVKKPEGFGKRGSSSYTAVLTERLVSEILNRLHQGELGVDVAREYGVTPTCISCIKKGKTWAHVPRPEGFNS